MDSVIENTNEKLQKDLDCTKEQYLCKPIVEYLQSVMTGELASQILLSHKSMKKCLEYVTSEARKLLKGQSGALAEQVVYDLAVAYFMLDDTQEEQKKAEAEKKRREESEAQQQKAKAEREAAAAKTAVKKAVSDNQLSLFEMMGGSANA